jgi:hypothetical protein
MCSQTLQARPLLVPFPILSLLLLAWLQPVLVPFFFPLLSLLLAPRVQVFLHFPAATSPLLAVARPAASPPALLDAQAGLLQAATAAAASHAAAAESGRSLAGRPLPGLGGTHFHAVSPAGARAAAPGGGGDDDGPGGGIGSVADSETPESATGRALAVANLNADGRDSSESSREYGARPAGNPAGSAGESATAAPAQAQAQAQAQAGPAASEARLSGAPAGLPTRPPQPRSRLDDSDRLPAASAAARLGAGLVSESGPGPARDGLTGAAGRGSRGADGAAAGAGEVVA